MFEGRIWLLSWILFYVIASRTLAKQSPVIKNKDIIGDCFVASLLAMT
jgi:hypothetical protein